MPNFRRPLVALGLLAALAFWPAQANPAAAMRLLDAKGLRVNPVTVTLGSGGDTRATLYTVRYTGRPSPGRDYGPSRQQVRRAVKHMKVAEAHVGHVMVATQQAANLAARRVAATFRPLAARVLRTRTSGRRPT